MIAARRGDRGAHYTKLLKAFINGSAGGLARIELVRLELIEVAGPGPLGPKYRLTGRGKERAERLGYIKRGAKGTQAAIK